MCEGGGTGSGWGGTLFGKQLNEGGVGGDVEVVGGEDAVQGGMATGLGSHRRRQGVVGRHGTREGSEECEAGPIGWEKVPTA